MSEMIPLNWNRIKLLDLVETSQAGEWGDEPIGDHNDVFVLRSTNFTNSGIIDYTKLVVRNITEKKRLSKLLKRGDIVLEKSGGSPSQPVGRVVYFDRDGDFLYSNFTQKITPSNVVDSKYFFYKLYFEYQNGLVLKFQQQTTGIINFQLSEYLNLREIFPPKNEQQKIASILTAVDEVIASTAAQINKLKDLKTGMMQELLTKGIGHTEFKDSPVGRIPKAWEVKQLGQLAKLERGRFSQRPRNDPAFYGGAIPFLQTGDIPKDSPYITSFTQTLNEKGLSVSKLFKQGTLVITIAATIGEIGLLKFDSCFPDSLVGITVNDTVADRSFLLYSMRSRKDDLESLAPQTAQKNINLDILNPFLLAVPSLKEQRVIGKSMETIDQKIDASTKKYIHFLSIKKALMQDLLTGTVRVLI